MKDEDKSREQLLDELAGLRLRVDALQADLAQRVQACDEQGEVTGFVGICTDMTALKQTMGALRESERRLLTLVANLPGMAYRCQNDPYWSMEYVSDGCFALTGYETSQMVHNAAVRFGDLIHSADRQRVWEQIQQAIAQKRRFQLSYRIRTAQGEEKWVWEQGIGIFSDNGNADAVEGFITDITERIRAEDALRTAHDELEQRVDQRTAELAQANQHLLCEIEERRHAQLALERERRTLAHMLRASDHERQLIAYDIHDGLAQQLAGAIMQFQVYAHLRKTRPDEAQKALDGGMTLLRQGHAEARRLIGGVRPPILDEVGLMAAISHLVNERGLQEEPQIQVHSKVNFSRLAPILENAIYRIVQEALSNACQHSHSPRVRISLLQRDARLRIEIRDWGVGFDPKAAHDNRYGLAGMRERVRLLGGRFRIRSRSNQGTSVVVEVPIVHRTAEE